MILCLVLERTQSNICSKTHRAIWGSPGLNISLYNVIGKWCKKLWIYITTKTYLDISMFRSSIEFYTLYQVRCWLLFSHLQLPSTSPRSLVRTRALPGVTTARETHKEREKEREREASDILIIDIYCKIYWMIDNYFNLLKCFLKATMTIGDALTLVSSGRIRTVAIPMPLSKTMFILRVAA